MGSVTWCVCLYINEISVVSILSQQATTCPDCKKKKAMLEMEALQDTINVSK